MPELRLASKLLAIVGIVLMITGGVLFFNSLGSGGGYFPLALIISGFVLIVVATLRTLF